MDGPSEGTHMYEAAEGAGTEGPTFNTPRSYTFKPGMTLPLSTLGTGGPNNLYCELLFAEQGAYVLVNYQGQTIVVPHGNQPVQIGDSLSAKYDHPRVKLIPILTQGVFRAGLPLTMTSMQIAEARAAIKAFQAPSVEIDDPAGEPHEESVAPIPASRPLPRNPTLVAEAPEVLRTYQDQGEKWVAPPSFDDEFMILSGDRVLYEARISRGADGTQTLLREGKDPILLGGANFMIRVNDHGEPGSPVKAMIFIEKGALTVQAVADHPIQVGSRDQIYRERLATMDGEDSVSVSATSTIYREGSGFTTPIQINDPERVIRMTAMGDWEAGASVVLLVREGFVTLQNRSTSDPDIKTTRVAPNGPAVSIQGHARVQLFDDHGHLNLAVIAMSADAPMRISDSLGNPGLLTGANLEDLRSLTAAPKSRPVAPAAAPSVPSEAELAQRPGCLPGILGDRKTWAKRLPGLFGAFGAIPLVDHEDED